MEFQIDQVYPWGRTLEEYVAMFGLGEAELAGRIVGCGDGPAAFNAELSRRGGRVTSLDPLYAFGAEEIRRRIDATFDVIIERTRREAERFVWTRIPSVEALGRMRMAAMETFLEDYDAGRRAGRYVAASLPKLPLADAGADLALSSHFLLLYSDEFSLEFHIEAVGKMLRVAREARIFPLYDMNGERSRHLDPLMRALRGQGRSAELVRVDYEFQRGANEYLQIR